MTAIGTALTKVFGSRNDRLLKRYRKIVAKINEWEPRVRPLTDRQLRDRTQDLRKDLIAGTIRIADVMPEAVAIMRESMDRHIGIREIFNPDQNFDPDKLDDANLELYDSVQRSMIASGIDYRQVEIPQPLYDAVRTLYSESRPPFRARCFDVQIIGGLVLSDGRIAEMKTGEGKTFVAPIAAFLKALQGMHTHVVTVNDYLVRRDALWVRPAFENLGMQVAFIQQTMMPGGQGRKDAYAADVTYGTNSEFGFDYLRDNMKERVDLQAQGPLDFAIIDEVDSILIDEARTPLIISGPAHDTAPDYRKADEIARHVMELARPWQKAQDKVDSVRKAIKAAEGEIDKAADKQEKAEAEKQMEEAQKRLIEAENEQASTVQYYELELDKKSVHLTHEGIAAAQEKAGIGSFYVGDNMDWPHLMEQAMRAHVVYERDKDYVVEVNPRTNQLEVVIVDEYTGRKMVGRQWSDGLHQAVEAKERVPIKEETQTLATITLQNFFKLYKGMSGMTGTAQTEAEEFMKIYKLDVVGIPTNRPVLRQDLNDLVYRTEQEKWEALLKDIKENSDAGRPVLVGTTSVEKSEFLSNLLARTYGVDHEVLNAKQHEREAHIVEMAGQQHQDRTGRTVGNVTIATNMAGRGTDIKPSRPAVDVGGLHVIGTERHTARRIDDQLRGRSGRQGDPGSSRFYVSLADPLMKMFMPEWAVNVLRRAGLQHGEPIDSKLVTKRIAGAQKKVEERNFLSRKNLLEYDEVMDTQRLSFYGLRQTVLEGRDIDRVIWDIIGKSIEDAVDRYVTNDYRAAVLAEWGRGTFDISLEPGDLAGLRRQGDIEDVFRQRARNEVGDAIQSVLGEFMGEDTTDSSGWDMKSIKSWAMSRYSVSLTERQIRELGSDGLADLLVEAAHAQIDKKDTSPIVPLLEPLYPLRELCKWAEDKFALGLQAEDLVQEGNLSLPPEQIITMIEEKAQIAYRRREVEYPIDHTLQLVTGGQEKVDSAEAAAYLADWAKVKYEVDLTIDHVQQTPADRLREEFRSHQEDFLHGERLGREVDAIIARTGGDPAATSEAFKNRFRLFINPEDLRPDRIRESRKGIPERDRDGSGDVDLRDVLLRKARYVIRKELTDLEQFVLINILDQAWKDHLYAMDMLKGGIGLQAFAERDPRVAYKREGSRAFTRMMETVRDRVTDLIFRVQVTGTPPKSRSAYTETVAQHQQVDDNAAAFGAGASEPAAATPAAQPAGVGVATAPAADKVKGQGRRTAPLVRNTKGKRRK